MKRSELTAYLDAYLQVESFSALDRSLNGLVVGGPDREISTVAFAVDACQQTFEQAIAQEADLLVVHHGLYWGSPLAVTGSHYQRLRTLLEGNLDLYAAHLPLDAHPQVGNNAVMAELLGLAHVEPFAPYKGRELGCKGVFPRSVDIAWICSRLGFSDPVVLDFGNQKICSVGLVSGGASSDVQYALQDRLDCFITGEVEHQIYHEAREGGITVIGGGHYQTETFGVRALMDHLAKRFSLSVLFIANPTGL